MHRNAQRLLSLINDLMDFGKLESGSLKLSVQAGNLPAFMEELAEEFRDWAIQKEIDFSLQVTEGKAAVAWFDRQVLEKIVLNLLHNAFKYTKEGGQITLEVLPSLEAFAPSFSNELVLKNPTRASRYAYIRVADTGIGISAESIHHLFERYYRITDSHLGSGVGLAFVKSLALLHKGDIYVYSERLKGTEIIIGIPVGEGDYRKEEKRAMAVEGGVRLEASPPGGRRRRFHRNFQCSRLFRSSGRWSFGGRWSPFCRLFGVRCGDGRSRGGWTGRSSTGRDDPPGRRQRRAAAFSQGQPESHVPGDRSRGWGRRVG